MLHHFRRTRDGSRPEFATGIDGGVNAGMNAVADDGAELAAAGIDERATDRGAVIFPVVPEIGCRGTGTKINAFPEDGVADVGKVADVGARENQAVLDFYGLADVAVVADAGVA